MNVKDTLTLTESQRARLQNLRAQWRDTALCTQPARRTECEEAVADIYKSLGWRSPKRYLWCDSPPAAMDEHIHPRLADGYPRQVPLRTRVGIRIWARVPDGVRQLVRTETVHAPELDGLERVWGPVLAELYRRTADPNDASSMEEINAPIGQRGFGPADIPWLAYYEFWHTAYGLALKPLEPLWALARNGGWWWPFPDVCVLAERPKLIRLDSESRLHHEAGPAMVFPDGRGVYSWHGTRVPRQFIMEQHALTTDDVLSAEDYDVRELMIQKSLAPDSSSRDRAPLLPDDPVKPRRFRPL